MEIASHSLYLTSLRSPKAVISFPQELTPPYFHRSSDFQSLQPAAYSSLSQNLRMRIKPQLFNKTSKMWNTATMFPQTILLFELSEI